MRIINLIDDIEGRKGCVPSHGLSFYIETHGHRVLMDFGPSEVVLSNASNLGVNLGEVDIGVLSHGHYDHSGGVMAFSRINDKATVYMQSTAGGEFYSEKKEGLKYIGIDKDITHLSQVKSFNGDYRIDDELSLFVIDNKEKRKLFTNALLKEKIGGTYIGDNFVHEQFLVIQSEGKSILMSGCAHNGIVNILEEYKRKYEGEPDVVISGFHLMKGASYTPEELQEVMDMANELAKYNTVFYTCHCTGEGAYNIMKDIMGDKLILVRTGDILYG